MKSSGFNIEDTHLTHLDRIERLFAVMIIAFAWAYLVGIYKNLMIKPIRILKHGRKAKSIFKYGLEEIANVLLNPWWKIQPILPPLVQFKLTPFIQSKLIPFVHLKLRPSNR